MRFRVTYLFCCVFVFFQIKTFSQASTDDPLKNIIKLERQGKLEEAMSILKDLLKKILPTAIILNMLPFYILSWDMFYL